MKLDIVLGLRPIVALALAPYPRQPARPLPHHLALSKVSLLARPVWAVAGPGDGLGFQIFFLGIPFAFLVFTDFVSTQDVSSVNPSKGEEEVPST